MAQPLLSAKLLLLAMKNIIEVINKITKTKMKASQTEALGKHCVNNIQKSDNPSEIANPIQT